MRVMRMTNATLKIIKNITTKTYQDQDCVGHDMCQTRYSTLSFVSKAALAHAG